MKMRCLKWFEWEGWSVEFGGLSLSLKFEFQKTLPSLLTIEGSYVPAAEQRISAVGLTIYISVVPLSASL